MTKLNVIESRICDPNVMLILTSAEQAKDLIALQNWMRGYDQSDSLLAAVEYLKDEDVIGWRVFWLGLLLHCLLCNGSTELRDFVSQRIPQDWTSSLTEFDVRRWYPLVRRNLEKANEVLDELDEHLTTTDQWLCVAYDGLEVYDAVGSHIAIRALVGLWFDRLRRWRRLHAKIFLRPDLFDIGRFNFPDASKLSGHAVRLD
ncbi:hypothetical protein [Alicyclobacillus fructus]|uniref:hypothetical protein n=1 Tax=Alicyclobacillus fructus TaxID=2816082 RepID=UPI001A8DA72F|nr:hypothetical protein [Alicyclobacillus fructus]